MATPPPPPPPGQPSIVGTNSLAGRLDSLTRAVTTLSNRFASASSGGTMNLGAFGPVGARTNYGEMRTRINEQRTIGQMVRDRQFSMNEAIYNDPNRSQSARDAAFSREEIQQRQHAEARRRMNAQLDQLDAQQRQQTTMNRYAVAGAVAGSIVGAARSYYSGNQEEIIGQYGRQASLWQNGGGGSPGQQARASMQANHNFGLHNVMTSPEDLAGGALTIRQQSFAVNENRMLRNAASMAFVNPGLGVQGAAQIQGEFGTSQAFYAAQMFGLAPTRMGGGRQNTPSTVMQSLAERNFGGRRLGQVSEAEFQDALGQGGSLSISMQNFGRVAGLSGQALESTRNELMVLRSLQANRGDWRGVGQEEAQNILSTAAQNNKAGQEARAKIAKSGLAQFGGSYQDAQRFLAGRSAEGHLSQSASFLDAAKASADTLADIYNVVNKALIASGFADLIGKIAGGLKGGGIIGSAMSGNIFGEIGKNGVGGGIKSWAGGLWDRAGEGLRGGWNSGPNIFFGDWGEGTDQSSWAKSLFGGETGAPRAKQGDKETGKNGKPKATGSGIGAILGFARAQIGERYSQENPQGPDHWDCSGLVQHAFAKAGIDLPRVTWDQVKQGVEVPMDALQAGDLVFYKDNSHVGIYTGSGTVVEAASPQYGVVEKPLGWSGKYTHARRILSGNVPAVESLSGKDKDTTTSWGSSKGGSGYSFASGYGSVEEVDALAAALAGGGGGGGIARTTRTPTSQQNEEASNSESSAPSAPKDPKGNMALGKAMAAADPYGWTGREWDALAELWKRESSWNANAVNPSSGAYGIPQVLPSAHGRPYKLGDAKAQIAWGLKYIQGRYTTPSKALAWHDSHNWYDRGAWEIPAGGQDARLHGGEMVLTKAQATTVRQALMEQGLGTGVGSPGTSGGGGGVNLQFGAGSIVITMPAASAEGAKSAAEQFVSYVAADDRIKSMLGGW